MALRARRVLPETQLVRRVRRVLRAPQLAQQVRPELRVRQLVQQVRPEVVLPAQALAVLRREHRHQPGA